MSTWQPIETAPRDGTEILLCRSVDADGKRIEGEHWGLFVQVASWWSGEGEDGEWVVYCSLSAEPRLHFEPTHWMPLPELPAVVFDALQETEEVSPEVTDCRSETGITVGLLDGIIAVARVAACRDLTAPAVREALKDLAADEDVGALLRGFNF